MAKASPARRNFNAGEWSVLVEGRTDLDKYGASMYRVVNGIAAPQGPFIGRSGTTFVTEAYSDSSTSHLVPFVYNEDETLQMEFSGNKLRFIFENGVQVFPFQAIDGMFSLTNVPFQFSCPGLAGVVIGDQVALAGFPSSYNINGVVATVINVVATTYTLDVILPVPSFGIIPGMSAAKVYVVDSPYAAADVHNIRALQDEDVVYLFCKGYQPRQLTRLGTTNWVFSLFNFDNGPFLNEDNTFGRLQLSATGRPVHVATFADSVAASPGTPGLIPTFGTAAAAFDGTVTSAWPGDGVQGGWIGCQFAVPVTINGYVIYPSYVNADATYAAEDYAPGAWTFEGSLDGVTYVVLDTQKDYVLYDDGRSVWFQFQNSVAYSYYRLRISQLKTNGDIKPRIAELVLSQSTPPIITVSIVGGTTINNSQGWLVTDVGRLIRAQGSDGQYRILRVVGYTSPTVVTAALLSEPFLDTTLISNWSIGYYCDTTGWPTCGTFFDDRMCVAGSRTYPGLVTCSRVGSYNDFQTKTASDVVLDDGALVLKVKSRKVSDIRWIDTDERGLIAGTGVGIQVVLPNNSDAGISARNVKGRNGPARGTAAIEPVKVDNRILHIHASRRTVREVSYDFSQTDSYVSRSLSLFASHLGIPQFAQMVYAAEPNSILWFRRDDGSMVGFTYNKDEDVLGWHTHNFSGAVESVSVSPSPSEKQDILWMVIVRNINGSSRRYIEKLNRFFDFDTTLDTCHYVDSGLRYSGPPTSVLYGLRHLEGQTVAALLNGVPFNNLKVVNGSLVSPIPDVTSAVVGVPYLQYAEIARLEAGAADGTAQDKVKRINSLGVHVWQTAKGEVGVFDEENETYLWEDIAYKEPYDELTGSVTLVTELLRPITMPEGYNINGRIAFRQTLPLPLNIIALYPQLNTQDRG